MSRSLLTRAPRVLSRAKRFPTGLFASLLVTSAGVHVVVTAMVFDPGPSAVPIIPPSPPLDVSVEIVDDPALPAVHFLAPRVDAPAPPLAPVPEDPEAPAPAHPEGVKPDMGQPGSRPADEAPRQFLHPTWTSTDASHSSVVFVADFAAVAAVPWLMKGLSEIETWRYEIRSLVAKEDIQRAVLFSPSLGRDESSVTLGALLTPRGVKRIHDKESDLLQEPSAHIYRADDNHAGVEHIRQWSDSSLWPTDLSLIQHDGDVIVVAANPYASQRISDNPAGLFRTLGAAWSGASNGPGIPFAGIELGDLTIGRFRLGCEKQRITMLFLLQDNGSVLVRVWYSLGGTEKDLALCLSTLGSEALTVLVLPILVGGFGLRLSPIVKRRTRRAKEERAEFVLQQPDVEALLHEIVRLSGPPAERRLFHRSPEYLGIPSCDDYIRTVDDCVAHARSTDSRLIDEALANHRKWGKMQRAADANERLALLCKQAAARLPAECGAR